MDHSAIIGCSYMAHTLNAISKNSTIITSATPHSYKLVYGLELFCAGSQHVNRSSRTC